MSLTDRDIKELIGHLVLQMRVAEMQLQEKDRRIAELEKDRGELKGGFE